MSIGWIIALVGAGLGFLLLLLCFIVAITLLGSARQRISTLEELVEAHKKRSAELAEEVVKARQQLAQAKVPVTLSLTEQQLMFMATSINNIREALNTPGNEVC